MFTFKEIGIIVAALQANSAEPQKEVLKKIDRMVQRRTLEAVIPQIKQPKETDKWHPSDRAKVFETQRELVSEIREIAKGGKSEVLVCVPNRGLKDILTETVGESLIPLGLQRKYCRGGSIVCENEFKVHVVDMNREEAVRGRPVDWAFFYNEVSGF